MQVNLDKSLSRTPKKWSQILSAIGIFIGVVVAVVFGGTYGIFAKWRAGNIIAPHYYIQGEAVGGLTEAAAQQNLEERFGRLFVTMRAPNKDIRVSLSQLGGELQYEDAVNQAYNYGRKGNLLVNYWQFWFPSIREKRESLRLRWDEDTLRKTMWDVAYTYNQDPQNAAIEIDAGAVKVIDEQPGRRLDVPESMNTIRQKYFPGLAEVAIQGETSEPELRAAQLQGEDVLLSKYTTRFNPGVRGRTENVRLAAAAVEGSVLMPGDTFSFNKSTGERTPKKGYQVAKIFVKLPDEEKSSIVDGVGGGVCQVSSTLYNAVLDSKKEGKKLKIVERNHHSLPVDYVPANRDATVAWPYKDFRFSNSYDFPIYLRTTMGRSELTIEVWGRIPHNRIAEAESDFTPVNY